jgi:curved DNA-binding protein
MAESDFYATLGVERGATEDEIKKAYRRLARKHHPDVNQNDPKAEHRFKEISAAYEVLSDAEKRRRYDEFGLRGLDAGFDPARAREYEAWQRGARRSPMHGEFEAPEDIEDLLGNLFGGRFGGGRAPRGPRKGQDIRGDIEVDFLDALNGGEVRVSVGDQTNLRVRIPAGSDEGTQIRLQGQGEPGGAGGPPGDLYLRIHVRPHAFYRRDGADVSLDLPVTLPELVRGASIEVPTPEGPVTLKVPAGSRPGQKLRLRGKGAPQRSGGRGDLYAVLDLRLPDTRDPKLAEIAQAMEPLYGAEDVRRELREPGKS